MELEEKTLRSSYPFRGKVVTVRVDEVRLPDGNESKREIVEHAGAVAIIPVNEDQEVLCIRQFRKAAEKVLLEIPAGLIEKGETLEACAQRELAEEIGFMSNELVKLTSFYPSPGFSSEVIHVYLAQDLVKKTVAQPDDEFILLETFPLKEGLAKIQSGVVEDGKTIVGLLMARQYLGL